MSPWSQAAAQGVTDNLVGRCRLTLWEPTLKALGCKRLKLEYDEPPPNFAFKFSLRRYNLVCCICQERRKDTVGLCRLTLSNPR